jgi:hypothetical protein
MIYQTREQAAAAVSAAATERDTIQANLLDLDGSFGKRLLAGASLTGLTQQRWESAAAELAALWETFTAYSAVVDRAGELVASGPRRPPPARLAEIAKLLGGPSVELTRAQAPLAQRGLTGSGKVQLTLAAAVREMQGAFGRVADVTGAAEAVWNEAADCLQQAGAELAEARRRTDGITDEALADTLGQAEADLAGLRDQVNRDPLALWRGGRMDRAGLDRLRQQASAAVASAARLAAVREDADRQIALTTAAVSTARAAYQDALAARQQVAAKILAGPLPGPPPVAGLTSRLAGLDAIKAAGRWARLAAELEALRQQAAAAAQGCRGAQQAALALLERRDELRGLLEAYQARAARLGAAEDSQLAVLEQRARELLWTAPCDLSAAGQAVTDYQQAVLALSRRAQRP